MEPSENQGEMLRQIQSRRFTAFRDSQICSAAVVLWSDFCRSSCEFIFLPQIFLPIHNSLEMDTGIVALRVAQESENCVGMSIVTLGDGTIDPAVFQ